MFEIPRIFVQLTAGNSQTKALTPTLSTESKTTDRSLRMFLSGIYIDQLPQILFKHVREFSVEIF